MKLADLCSAPVRTNEPAATHISKSSKRRARIFSTAASMSSNKSMMSLDFICAMVAELHWWASIGQWQCTSDFYISKPHCGAPTVASDAAQSQAELRKQAEADHAGELQSLRDTIESLTLERAQLERTHEVETQRLQGMLSMLETEWKQADRTEEAHSKAKQELQDEIAYLESQLESQQFFECECAAARGELKQTVAACREYAQKCQEKEKDLEKFRISEDDWRQTVAKQTEEIEQLRHARDAVAQRCSEAEGELEAQRAEAEELVARPVVEAAIDQLRQQMADVAKKKISELESQISKLQAKLVVQNQVIQDLRTRGK